MSTTEQSEGKLIRSILDDVKRRELIVTVTHRLRTVNILAGVSTLLFGLCIITDRVSSSSQILLAFVTLVLWSVVFKFDSDLLLINVIEKMIKRVEEHKQDNES